MEPVRAGLPVSLRTTVKDAIAIMRTAASANKTRFMRIALYAEYELIKTPAGGSADGCQVVCAQKSKTADIEQIL